MSKGLSSEMGFQVMSTGTEMTHWVILSIITPVHVIICTGEGFYIASIVSGTKFWLVTGTGSADNS